MGFDVTETRERCDMTVVRVDFRRPKEELSCRSIWLLLLAANASVWIAVPWAIWFWRHR